MRKPEITLPTFLGILLTVGGLATGLILLKNPLRNLVGATAESAPQNVKIGNITDNGFAVSWTTAKATPGFIKYGESGPELIVSDDRDQEKGSVGNIFTHFVTVKGLKPLTNYKFNIGGYDQAFVVSTGPVLRNPPTSDVAYGQVLTTSGEPAEGALVYLQLPGTVLQATLVKPSGSWVVPLSTARTTDLTSFAAYDRQNSQVQIFVDGGVLGNSTITTTTANDSPVAAITLGNTPSVILSPTQSPLPPSTPAVSKFTSTSLEILSPQLKERVNSRTPEIMGKAPPGSEVTIEIHSPTPINSTVTADEAGDFSYTVPQKLEPGEHTITISTLVNGVIKKVSKTFIVEAAGVTNKPSFTASPSATLKPTPTAIPRVAYPDTSTGTPKSGDLTSTLLLLILGAGLCMSGLFVYGFHSATH